MIQILLDGDVWVYGSAASADGFRSAYISLPASDGGRVWEFADFLLGDNVRTYRGRNGRWVVKVENTDRLDVMSMVNRFGA